MTVFPVSSLRSVDVGTPDIDGSEGFYTEVWGLDVAARAAGAVYLRATGPDHHVLVLYSSDQPELRSVTFRVGSEDALHRIAAAAPATGADIITVPAANTGPDGGIELTIREPQGGVLRFVYGDRQHGDVRPVPNRPLRLAHVNINSTDVDAATTFYRSALGFQLTDRSKLMAFVRCNSDHHAVVLADAPVNGLNHIAFLMPDLESVMRGSGRLVDHGFPIGWGIGRHGPGDNVFAYFVDPTGVVIEYTAEVLQVDDGYVVRGPDEWQWPPGRTDHWGIAPPKSDAVKAAQTAVLHAARATR
ncbi:MAG: VOC family protein [Acidisphaera sp.]|nr:VOC family protein [Acidisphaera sp.]